MDVLRWIDTADTELVQIVDAALAEGVRKSGPHVVCKPGCTECCIGPFGITQLDARRLQRGLEELEANDPERARRVRARADEAAARLAPSFPGDAATGILSQDEDAVGHFETWAEDEPCPALDPETQMCDLYAWRPLTCRTFGPAVTFGGTGLGVCELCYQGATEQEIAACAVEIESQAGEDRLLDALCQATGVEGETIVAFALTGSGRSRPAESSGSRP